MKTKSNSLIKQHIIINEEVLTCLQSIQYKLVKHNEEMEEYYMIKEVIEELGRYLKTVDVPQAVEEEKEKARLIRQILAKNSCMF